MFYLEVLRKSCLIGGRMLIAYVVKVVAEWGPNSICHELYVDERYTCGGESIRWTLNSLQIFPLSSLQNDQN